MEIGFQLFILIFGRVGDEERERKIQPSLNFPFSSYSEKGLKFSKFSTQISNPPIFPDTQTSHSIS